MSYEERDIYETEKEEIIKAGLEAVKDCDLEFCCRDIYTINGDRPRLKQWVDMVRSMIGE